MSVGCISQVGSGVSSLEVGRYTTIPDNLVTGHIEMGVGTSLPSGAPYFGDDIGGLQAEYARVLFADMSLILVPLTTETTNSSVEQDYVTVSDF
ncbi:Uncharacterized protein HZ326_24004 [Fusarium oxysporum f. sp. albedinis]|nr:Uncharacterized protein HZ326_24004 [Fusarium oxysporum f. sp. albedinis]